MGGQIGCAEGAPLEALVHVGACNVVRRGRMCMCRWARRPRTVDMDRYSGARCLSSQGRTSNKTEAVGGLERGICPS